MRRITHIVLHTSASWNARLGVLDPSVEDIDRMHRAKGWSEIGYHYVVRRNGSVEEGRDVRRPGAHVRGFNSTTVGICVTGHGDYSRWTVLQWQSALELCEKLLSRFGLIETFKKNPMRVIGHAEVGKFRQEIGRLLGSKAPPDPHKSCPGTLIDLPQFRRDLLGRIERH